MKGGAAEVETGAGLADQAGSSLTEIATAVTAVQAAVGRITSAVAAMGKASTGVVAVMDQIATLAATNASAAGKMTSESAGVSRAIESIAAVSEEDRGVGDPDFFGRDGRPTPTSRGPQGRPGIRSRPAVSAGIPPAPRGGHPGWVQISG